MPKNGVIYCSKSCADHHNVKFAVQVGLNPSLYDIDGKTKFNEIFSIFKKLKNLSVNMLDIRLTLNRIKMRTKKKEFHFPGEHTKFFENETAYFG